MTVSSKILTAISITILGIALNCSLMFHFIPSMDVYDIGLIFIVGTYFFSFLLYQIATFKEVK